MIISDLSYLNEISENVIGGYQSFRFDFNKDIKVDVDIDAKSDVDAKGAYNQATVKLAAFGSKGSATNFTSEQIAEETYYGYVSYQSSSATSFAK